MNSLQTLILAGSLLSSSLMFSQNMQFYREDLSFEIRNGFFYVDGTYNFLNNSDKPVQQLLFYPFPVDSAYGSVDSMTAVDAKSRNVIGNKTQTGFYFNVELPAYGIGKYKLAYKQKLLGNKAEYILVTTQKWGKPFENAQYSLTVPAKMKITSFSYQPESTENSTNSTTYFWNKKDFMPDQNMIFYFEK